MCTTYKRNVVQIWRSKWKFLNSIEKSPRESNLELLRIFAMLAIIAHHFVVNSGVEQLMNYANPQTNDYILAVYGAWGKTAINSFILISGYFLCKSEMTWQRWLKLYIEIQYYSWMIITIFAITGYETPTVNSLIRSLCFPFADINNSFNSSFMIFYAGVPLYNKLLQGLSCKSLILLLVVLLGMFTCSSTFFGAKTMNEPFCYMTLYFVAAYIRKYPNKWTESYRIALFVLFITAVVAIAYILLKMSKGKTDVLSFIFWYVSDSNKLFAFVIGLSAFLVAKNIPSFHNKLINRLASGCFGVLLIHASSDTMRRWLWQDVINVSAFYQSDTAKLIIVILITPISIYIVCSIIDLLRQRWVEKPLMKVLNKLLNKLQWEN